MLIHLALVIAALLTGCASPSARQLGDAAYHRGQYQAAEQHYFQAIQEGDGGAWNNLGVIYGNQGRPADAIRAYTMGARYGNATAQANLIRLNQQVPAADLASRPSSDSGGSGAAAFLEGFNRGRNRSRTRDCIATPIGRSVVNLDCD